MESYSIADRVKVIREHYRNGAKIENTHRVLREHFGRKNRPDEVQIEQLVRKFETTGSVDELPKPSKVKSVLTLENIQSIRTEDIRIEKEKKRKVKVKKEKEITDDEDMKKEKSSSDDDD